MIEIDDAGWGDLLDGVVLGFLRVESGTFLTRVIDVRFFRPPLFAQKSYLVEALKLTREVLRDFSIDKGEEIRICTAAVLENVRTTLTKEGYRVTPTKIVGELQVRVEGAFIKRLEKLGLAEGSVPMEPSKERFYVQLSWIHGDLAKREKYVKTAFKSWRRWRLWRPREKTQSRARVTRTTEEDWGRW